MKQILVYIHFEIFEHLDINLFGGKEIDSLSVYDFKTF